MLQRDALNILKAGRNVYLTGAPGSGKTHTLREYIEHLKDRNVVVGVTASTGIAATHLGGVTIHSWSGLGIKELLSPNDIEELQQKEYLWKRFEKTQVLIIDEISMLTPQIFDSLDALSQAMKRNDKPFGGMQVVLSGDFFQLPPITHGNQSPQFVNRSDAWSAMDIRVCYLSEQHRHDGGTLLNILNEIRSDSLAQESQELLLERLEQKEKTLSPDITPTRLYTHNRNVDEVNDEELSKLSGNVHMYEMKGRGKANLVEALKKGVLAPETLKLKKNAVVMFVKNNFEAGYVNGTLGIVEDFNAEMPIVRTFSGDKISVHGAEWTILDGEKIVARVEQLPLRLAWAITIHKSQGMSLDAAEIDLSKSFVEGQGYVALSRLRSLEGLVLNGINDMALSVNKDVLRFDKELQSESSKWGSVISRFSDQKLEKMHNEFIELSGGTIDKIEIEKNKAKTLDNIKEKIPTIEKTKILLEKGLSPEEIAKERGMVVGTIISHLEKLKEQNNAVILSYLKKYKPKASDMKKIKTAFKEIDGIKLAPVHSKLRGAYTYDELRFARLFL